MRDGDEDFDATASPTRSRTPTGRTRAGATRTATGAPTATRTPGTVAAFDGGRLTIALARGGALSGIVDAETEVYCDVEAGYEDEAGSADSEAGYEDEDDGGYEDDDDFADGEDDADLFTVTARLAEEGDEDAADDQDWSDEEDGDCRTELAPGAVIHEPELEDGVFWAVELVLAG